MGKSDTRSLAAGQGGRRVTRRGEPIQTPAAPNAVIQGLWIGPELSVMEQLSISSFILNGHQYHLYVYDDVKNVPAGTVLRDASEILPSSRIFQYRGQPSYAGFSNFFRCKLLLERGGWWVDSDVVCLKPFDFADDYVFAAESDDRQDVATNCVMKVPAGSPAMAHAWEVCQSKNPEDLVWGVTGPMLLRETIRAFALEQYQRPHQTFCPVHYWNWFHVLESEHRSLVADERSYAIHLWNEMWRQSTHDKNGRPPKGSYFEHLQERFLRIVCYD
jgi:mannosyltransferase OCH1-like enzyme